VIIRGLATAGARAAHTLEARRALPARRRAGHHLVAAGAPRVAGEARRAGAHRQVVHHRAEGVGAAGGGGGGAGVRALVVDAGEAGRAAGAGAAAQHAGHTLADLLAVAVVVQPWRKHTGDESMLLMQDYHVPDPEPKDPYVFMPLGPGSVMILPSTSKKLRKSMMSTVS
jgi:hypothetical protein